MAKTNRDKNVTSTHLRMIFYDKFKITFKFLHFKYNIPILLTIQCRKLLHKLYFCLTYTNPIHNNARR